MGSLMNTIERNFAKFIGVKQVILTNFGRTALYAALRGSNIKKGDEVLLPGYICEVVPKAVLKIGAIPVFVDIENNGRFWISTEDLERKLSSRTKGIIVNYCFGFINELDELLKISDDFNVLLIEDCAHALGGKNEKGIRVGNIGHIGVFSFSKSLLFNISGGAITSNDDEILKRVEAIIVSKNGLYNWLYQFYFGALSRVELKANTSKLYHLAFDIITNLSTSLPHKGYESSLKIPNVTKASLLQKALLAIQMRYIDNLNMLRNNKCKALFEILEKSSSKLEVPPIKKNDVCTWVPFIFKQIRYRNKLYKRLKSHNIFLSTFWDPSFVVSADECPNAIDISRRTLVMKLDPLMENDQIVRIGQTIKREVENL